MSNFFYYEETIFSLSVYSTRTLGGSSQSLSLKVADNNFVCDDEMHWIKCGQEHGWIQLLDTLECTNAPNILWDDQVLSLAGKVRILSSFIYSIRFRYLPILGYESNSIA